MIYADHELGYRLESLIRAEYRRLVTVALEVLPHHAPECLDVAGGVAIWLGEGSPVNGTVAVGMDGPVDDRALAHVEAFYHDRGEAATLAACPFADPSLLHALGRRRWVPTEFENVLALELPAAAGHGHRGAHTGREGTDFDVRVCLPEERATWGWAAAQGFSDGAPERAHEEFGRIMAAREDAILVLAWVDDEPAGTGSLVIDGGVGWLSGDSTFPRHRGRGIQQAIQRRRLELAQAAGCDLAVTESAPGSQSQRNMERLGFRVVYTHVQFEKPEQPEPE
jgi:hypothetical protein